MAHLSPFLLSQPKHRSSRANGELGGPMDLLPPPGPGALLRDPLGHCLRLDAHGAFVEVAQEGFCVAQQEAEL